MTSNDYQNPILCADYSDPDIVRVGDDFFMVSSSFNHMPALPILHSTDLVSWKIINHVFNALPLAGFHEYQPGKGRDVDRHAPATKAEGAGLGFPATSRAAAPNRMVESARTARRRTRQAHEEQR